MSFFWYQKTGGEEAWHEALSDQRQRVISDIKPAFVTVLDAFSIPDTETWGKEDYAKMRFSGPLYFDWDAEDLKDTIPPFLEFLAKLEEHGVDLKSLRLYATGGRGFHCEIPEPIFIPKVGKTGINSLPYIYREMAFELATDKMDLRVYTGRKGRMWRCPGVQRPNGKYKVPITLDEALAMTPELYSEVTSEPREEPVREAPTLNVYLSTLFEKSRNKYETQLKIRAKNKGDSETLARFKGQFPPTAVRIMRGEGLVPNVGFHKVAMQLAITANALGKTSEELVSMCEGLVQSHQSDGDRYNTPRKRKEELRRMWDYTNDNPAYDYSKGGLKSLCAAGVNTGDLDSPIENLGVGMVQEDDTPLPEDLQADVSTAHGSLLEGLIMLRDGVFKRTAEGAKMLSNISFSQPNKMVDAEDGLQVGLEVRVVSDGVDQGRHLVPLNVFRSKTSLNDFCLGRGAVFSGSDTQASVIQLILTRKAVKDAKTTYIVRREGVDIVHDPSQREELRRHVIWVCPDAVMGHTDGVLYRYQPKVSTGPVFKSDVHTATPLVADDDTRAWLSALFTMNSPVTVGLMLGWFVSCFHKQFYQAAYNQFPLLHPNGTAGSGKTQTTHLLARMFYNTNQVQMFSASANASSAFSMKAAWTASASIPVIIDEYKPSELGQTRYDFLLQHFRLLYNQGGGASGGINRGGMDSSFRDVTQYAYSAPTVYLGESQEMQTAIVQRTVSVGFSQQESAQHTASFNLASAEANVHLAGRLGRLLLARSLGETVRSRVAALDPVRDLLRATMDRSVHDRQVYNLAVVVSGLDFLGQTLHEVFGDEFDGAIAGLREALFSHKDELNTFAMSESSKVLNDMALISRTEDPDSEFALREGYEYLVNEGNLELLVKESFIKYFAWANRKGLKPLYTTPEGFINSLGKSPAISDLRCFDSKLRGSPMSKVFRLSLSRLVEEGVETFKSKSFD